MMKKNIIVLTIALSSVLFSCNKEIGVNGNSDISMASVELLAKTEETEEEGKKVTVDGTKTSWEIDDSVAVFVRPNGSSAYPAYRFTVLSTSVEDGKSAVMSGKVPTNVSTFLYAVYPYDSKASSDWSGNIKNYTIPAIQNGKFSNVVFHGTPGEIKANTDANKTYSFKAVSGIIKLNVPAELNVKAITLTANTNLAGTFTIGTDGKISTSSISNGSSQITITAEEGETLSGNVYAAVLPQVKGSTYKLSMKVINKDLMCATFGEKSGMKACVAGQIEKLGTLPATTTFPNSAMCFSVSKTNKVIFSPGLLQYQASSGKWRFAQDQLTFIGDNPGNNTYANGTYDQSNRANNESWIDLFPYGHSGGDYKPYECLNINQPYFSDREGAKYLTGNNAKYDWGHNTIQNGDSEDDPDTWRLLTSDEFEYMLKSRDGVDRFCRVVIDNSIKALMILPDMFFWPLSVQKPQSPPVNHIYGGWEWNITTAQYQALQSNGAVFLPICGWRPGGVNNDGSFSILFIDNLQSNTSFMLYWTSSAAGYYVSAGNMGTNTSLGARAAAVRLIKDVQ